jgi:hypothetical protein
MMASPLNFLRRLVSRGGERKQDADKGNASTPDDLAIAAPAEALAEEDSGHAEQAVSVQTAPVDEAETEIYGTADGVRATIPAFGGSASADETDIAVTTANDATEFPPAVEGVTRKRRAHGKNTKPVVVPTEVSQAPRTASDNTMSLDEEIRMLRGQLAIKLQMQNAQLRKMLERFQR